MSRRLMRNLALGVLVSLAVLACRDEDFPNLETPIAKAELIQGTWAVSSIYLNDEDLSGLNLAGNDGSLTPVGGFTITFNNTGYTIQTGSLPSPATAETGNWAFDDAGFPTAINFGDEGAGAATLVSVPTTGSSSFSFEFTAGCGENTYRYELTKQ